MHSNINSLAQPLADKTAIGLSLLCAIHCLALPVLVVLAPALGSMAIADESFHLWVVVVAIPVSAYALLLGCRKHRHFSVLATGILGLTVLGLAALAGHDLVGESGERALTLLGAFIIAWSHLRNYRYCQGASRCDSPQ